MRRPAGFTECRPILAGAASPAAGYSPGMSDSLTPNDVRKVAALARLRLDDDRVDPVRGELEGILDHVARLQAIDVDDVEPMSHPLDLSNRLAEDVVGPALPVEQLLRNAPATEGDFLAVPKVLDGGEG